MRPGAQGRPLPGRRGRRVGLMGGSFNPAHAGHRHIALLALRRLRLDEVWWLVAPQNPLKPRRGMAPLEERLAGARRVARHPAIRVSDLEARLGSSFTADTLAWIRQRAPGARLVWIMGADNLGQLHRWRDWRGIARTVAIAVFDRPSYAFRSLAGPAARRLARHRIAQSRAVLLPGRRPPAWVYLRLRLHPASGTDIRARGKARHDGAA